MSDADGLPIDVEELRLRRVDYEDLADLHEIYADPEVCQYEFFDCWIEEAVEGFIASQSNVRPGDPGVPLVLIVEHRLEEKVIGNCQITINSVEDRQGEIGFAFNSRFLGRGLATKAVREALGYGFLRLSLHRIIAAVDARNERSWKLMERLGMRREAHFLHDNLSKGQWVDDFVYAMLEDEWRLRYAGDRQ